MSDLHFHVLGSLQADRDGVALGLGGPKQRVVLAMLVLNVGKIVSDTQLIEAVWADAAHDRARSTLQVYVANLRKVLEPDRDARQGFDVLCTEAPGYVVRAGREHVDLFRFEDTLTAARDAVRSGDAERATARFDDALALWRGDPLADVHEHSDALAREATRLREVHLGVIEESIDAQLVAGRHQAQVAPLEALVRDHPFRERLRGQLMTALYRSGRQADALRAFEDARTCLVEELGLDPSPALQELNAAILRHDLTLRAPGPGEQHGDRAASGSDQEADVPTRRARPGDLGLAALLLPDGSTHRLTSAPCIIGRTAECALTIRDPDVSRRHAVIRKVDDRFVLADLGSTNGTVVNGEDVSEHTLDAGDEITVGSTVLRFDRL